MFLVAATVCWHGQEGWNDAKHLAQTWVPQTHDTHLLIFCSDPARKCRFIILRTARAFGGDCYLAVLRLIAVERLGSSAFLLPRSIQQGLWIRAQADCLSSVPIESLWQRTHKSHVPVHILTRTIDLYYILPWWSVQASRMRHSANAGSPLHGQHQSASTYIRITWS